jgi:hypothetical protein
VDERDDKWLSAHITRNPSGAIELADTATHDADYALTSYVLHTNQLGQRGSIDVQKDRVAFHLVDAAGERTATEQPTEPVVVGPTLVGYVVKHLDQLRAGETITVRLAVLDRLETIGFNLEAVDPTEPSNPDQTQVRMTPSSFILGLVIDPIDFTFDTKTRKLVRLEGRVPPKVRLDDTWQDFDARVEYQFVANEYR